ncbi:hypothetical protein BJX61DRAFT_543536 [Aspergillus egyptiacus]|nr:hypothetical protein BJX61DRAFT_543536 [Aspergillus egyptiacus]
MLFGYMKNNVAVPLREMRKAKYNIYLFGVRMIDTGRDIKSSLIPRSFMRYALGAILIAVGIPLTTLSGGLFFAKYLASNIPIPDNIRIEFNNPSNDSIGVTVTGDVPVPASRDVTLWPTDVSFFFADGDADADQTPSYPPIASVALPELKYGTAEHFTIPEQRLKLEDPNALAQSINAVAFRPSLSLGAKATTKIQLGWMITWVDLCRTVELSAFNAFPSSLVIPELRLQRRDANGYNLHAKIVVNNPIPASITLGDVTLNILIGNITIGEARASVANIIPGENILNIDAKLSVTNIQENIEAILEVEMPYLKNEEILASASVTSIVHEGQHLAYWEEIFGLVELNLKRPVRPLVQSVLDTGFLGSYVNPMVERVTNTILTRVKEMEGDDLDAYAGGLGDLAKTALTVLWALGIV